MDDIDDPEYIEERREEIAAALKSEEISKQMIDEMDPDAALDVIVEALLKHDVPE
jgi:hypothetical protein